MSKSYHVAAVRFTALSIAQDVTQGEDASGGLGSQEGQDLVATSEASGADPVQAVRNEITAYVLPDTLKVMGHNVSTKPLAASAKENAKLIRTAQDNIQKAGQQLDFMIAENAVQCLVHAKTHGDTSLMVRLLQKLPKGYRTEAVKSYLMDVKAPIKVKGTVQGGDLQITMNKDAPGGWKNDVNWKGLETTQPVTAYLAGKKSEVAVARAESRQNAPDTRKPLTVDYLSGQMGMADKGLLSILRNATDMKRDKTKSQFRGIEKGYTLDQLQTALHYARQSFLWAVMHPAEARAVMAEREASREAADVERRVQNLMTNKKITDEEARALLALADGVKETPEEAAEEQPEEDTSGDIVLEVLNETQGVAEEQPDMPPVEEAA